MFRPPRWRVPASLLICLLLWAPAAVGAEEPASATTPEATDPTATVERLHEALLGVMKDADRLGYAGRYDQLGPVLQECFDIPFMAEKTVGRHWKKAGGEQRERLVETFGRFTVANYAGRFDGYSGQIFKTLSTEPSSRATLLVKTRLNEPEGEGVELDYRLRQVDGHWKIIDVYLNGTVSELALRRSEYSSLIARKGFDALLAALDQKIADLAAAPADKSS